MEGRITIKFDLVDADTPTLPDAVRGACADPPVTETPEQLVAGLVWWACLFCGRSVLVDIRPRGRERCECGAVRCHHCGTEGWRRDGEEIWFI